MRDFDEWNLQYFEQNCKGRPMVRGATRWQPCDVVGHILHQQVMGSMISLVMLSKVAFGAQFNLSPLMCFVKFYTSPHWVDSGESWRCQKCRDMPRFRNSLAVPAAVGHRPLEFLVSESQKPSNHANTLEKIKAIPEMGIEASPNQQEDGQFGSLLKTLRYRYTIAKSLQTQQKPGYKLSMGLISG